MKHSILILLGLSLFTSTAFSAEPVQLKSVEAYPFGNMEAEIIEELAKSLLSEDATILVDKANQRLLVVATSAEQNMLAAALDQTKIPPMNVRIDVRFEQEQTQSDREASIRPEGRIIITDRGFGGSIRINPTLRNWRGGSTRNVTQSLLVANGRSGTLRVGRDVPYIDWFMEYGRHWRIIERELRWQKVGSFLSVEPLVIGAGPTIKLKIVPELRGLVNGDPRHVRFTSAATEVTVNSGQTVSIGGMNDDNEFYSRFLIGGRSGQDNSSLDIRLTPQIIHPR